MSRFGPGTAHLHELLRNAIEQGFRVFDFTIGDETYKRDWAETKLTLYDYSAGETLPGRGAVAVIFFLRRLKRFIKQTPVLWRCVGLLRAITARLTGKAKAAADEQG
jgi:CelD/BcsL family acetyltransferase involved in cellulose biosynthesis